MLADRIIELLERAPATYDGLRGSLGCQSADLDAAIRMLERTQSIHRDRGRFCLVGSSAPPAEAAAATINGGSNVTTKTCSICETEKPASEFYANGKQCKACLAKKSAARYAAKHGKRGNGATAKPRAKSNGDSDLVGRLREKRDNLMHSVELIDQAIELLEAI